MNKRTALKWMGGELALLGAAGSVGCGAADSADTAEGEPVATAEQGIDPDRFWNFRTIRPEGIFTGPPAVLNVSGDLNEIDIYGVGTDRAVWSATLPSLTGDGWESWVRLGDIICSGRPSVTMWHAAGRPPVPVTRKALVATGVEGLVWIRGTTGKDTPWGSWGALPDSWTIGSPAIAFVKPYLFVVIRKADNKFYWSRNDVSTGLDNTKWTTPWKPILSGVFLDDPAITASSTRFVVAGRGTDNRIWLADTTDAGDNWNGWRRVLDDANGARTFQDAPAISYHGSLIEVAARPAGSSGVVVATVTVSSGFNSGWKGLGALKGPTEGSNSPGSAGDRTSSNGRYLVAVRLGGSNTPTGYYMGNLWE